MNAKKKEKEKEEDKKGKRMSESGSTLEKTQGQIDGFLNQLLSKCHLLQVASVGD